MAEQKKKDPNIVAVKAFIKEIARLYSAGDASEHTYRTPLQNLLKELGGTEIDPRQEGKSVGGNTPDFTIKRGDRIIGHLEAKDIVVGIHNFKGANIDQFDRYKQKMANLVYTNNLDWNFYRNGKLVNSISIAKLKRGKIETNSDNFPELIIYLKDFLDQNPQSITTAEALTGYMVSKTHIIRDLFLENMTGKNPLKSLEKQYDTIVKQLIRWLEKDEFVDMYAQTITYGLFVARLNSKTPKTFSRDELLKLVPENYPFLKDLFEFISTKALEEETLDRYIDDLIGIYQTATVEEIMATYGKGSGREDPFLHFYEDFLTKYDPAKQKGGGVYYTPDEVVDFIVRAVDWVLKEKFNLDDGLATAEKIIDAKQFDPVHKVQILDPATGTGTFLAKTIHYIAEHMNSKTSGNWSSYVNKDLLPRLHGFEIMMAPYVMCYLKLNMVLKDLKYTPPKKNPERMSIYLTNSLTSSNQAATDFGFNNHWLEQEAEGATKIKDQLPIMCVIGNPPYNAKSKNDDKWILNLIADYKKEPDSIEKLDEKNIQTLNNDYVKFLRLAQYMVDKNGEGVVGMITGHGYLYGPTFRGMRWNLMKSFDEIYILDLHGDSLKGTFAPTGERDINVFQITTGVSIIIAWKKKRKKGAKKPLAKVFHGDLWGARQIKFDRLEKERLDSKLFQQVYPRAPYYSFNHEDYALLEKYEKGFRITDFMQEKSSGITTHRDHLVFDMDKQTLIDRIETFYDRTKVPKEIKDIFELTETGGWSVKKAWETGKFDPANVISCLFRPFDTRSLYYASNLITRDRRKVMRHFTEGDNLGLVTQRITPHEGAWTDVLITENAIDGHITGSRSSVFPLYVYPAAKKDNRQKKSNLNAKPSVNMDRDIRKAIENIATDKEHGKPDEYAIFDYIYGILHAPTYRKLYSKPLKEDFPRIPYPKDSAEFWHLSQKGTTLRHLHLMDKKKIKFNTDAYPFDGEGDSKVKRWERDENGKVWINDTQYFDNVPESAWERYIGGWQPAQEWLKDHKDRTLEQLDLEHYQRIIAVLVKTYETMDEIVWTRG